NDSDEEIDIVVRHDIKDRTIDQLDKIRIETSAGAVPISNFVNRVPKQSVGIINRADQRRIVTVQADLPPGFNITERVDQIRQWLADNQEKLDPDVEITFKG